MSQIGLYHGLRYELEPRDDDIAISSVEHVGDDITVAEYEYETEAMFGSSTTYNARLIQFNSLPGSPIGIELPGDASIFDTVAEQISDSLQPVTIAPEQFWQLLNDAPDHGVYNLQLRHPTCGMEDIEDIASRLENKNMPSEVDVRSYYEEACDEEYPVITGPNIQVDTVDTKFSLDQYHEPVTVLPRDNLTVDDFEGLADFFSTADWKNLIPDPEEASVTSE